MPGYKTHVVGGIITFTGFFCALQKSYLTHCTFLTAFSYFFVTILGSLFPDVDTKSKGQMMFYQALAFYLLFLLWSRKFMTFMIVTCITMLPLLVPHRGLFHNIWFLTSIVGIVSITSFVYIPTKALEIIIHLLFFYAGAISHIFLDRCMTAIKFR